VGGRPLVHELPGIAALEDPVAVAVSESAEQGYGAKIESIPLTVPSVMNTFRLPCTPPLQRRRRRGLTNRLPGSSCNEQNAVPL